MDRTVHKALSIILTSLGLAIVFNFLFFGKLIGISALIYVSILLGVVFLIGSYYQLRFQKTWWIILLIIFFALMLGIRANEFLSFLNLCAALSLLLLLAHQLAGAPALLLRLRDYFFLIVHVPFRMLGRAFATVSLVGQVHSSIKNRDVWLRILKGVVMALPVLFIFGVLFSKADLVFSQFMRGIVDIQISERTAQYLALLTFAFMAALGFLSYIFFPKQTQKAATESNAARIGKEIEVLVFLGLISTLFLVFIGFQIAYLFGGEANIINRGFTYAEYARRGFFELLAVAALSLLILLTSEKYAGVETKKDWRFQIPALTLIIEVVIVMVSAFKRLSLYIDVYGMTLLRFYVAGFIMLLLVMFFLLAVKFIKSKKEQFFAFGALLSITAFLVVVNIMNPDAFIAKTNLKQYTQTRKLDVVYMGQLSADAEPWKIELYKKLQGEDKENFRKWLQTQKNNLQKSSADWQSANLSRSRALQLLQEFKEW